MKIGPYEVPGFAVGHALDLLRALPDESVQCCVTSPPYWSLRSYGTPPAILGGETGCSHEWGARQSRKAGGGQPGEKRRWQHEGRGPSGHPEADAGNFCVKCGAWFGELGIEPTPEVYIEHLVEIFHEVHRALRKDGTLWLNLGDCYAVGTNSATSFRRDRAQCCPTNKNKRDSGLKSKDLVMLPARVALALQADGWYLRSDIIWAKPNPMPESCADRPTASHEHIFLFSKSERYYYDAEAIAEPVTEGTLQRISQATFDQQTGGPKDYSHGTNPNRSARRALVNLKKRAQAPQIEDSPESYHLTRNSRNVWTIATKPDRSAHFAVFPPEIPRRCILAGTKQGDLVLDPFVGSGTTCRVAEDLGRAWLGFDASAEYVEKYCRPRLAQRGLFGGAS